MTDVTEQTEATEPTELTEASAGGQDMVPIPGGSVTLHDRRTETTWRVDVDPFLLASVPVTQGLYREVTGAEPSASRGDRLPVESVSWFDAVHCCTAMSVRDGFEPVYRRTGDTVTVRAAADGYRLPTEAEWEFACRAGTLTPRYAELDEIAWYADNSDDRVHEVGGKMPNRGGLYDMIGNVWEWCVDRYDPVVYGDYRVLRGGGWSDREWSCRAGVRRRSHPTFVIDDVGFRVARSISPGPGLASP